MSIPHLSRASGKDVVSTHVRSLRDVEGQVRQGKDGQSPSIRITCGLLVSGLHTSAVGDS